MSEVLDVVRAFHAAFEERDEERFVALVADDIEILNPLGTTVAVGRSAALEWLRTNVRDDVHVTPAGEPTVDGQTVTWPMTMLIASRGVELPSAGVFHVRDGLIARFEPKTGRG